MSRNTVAAATAVCLAITDELFNYVPDRYAKAQGEMMLRR